MDRARHRLILVSSQVSIACHLLSGFGAVNLAGISTVDLAEFKGGFMVPGAEAITGAGGKMGIEASVTDLSGIVSVFNGSAGLVDMEAVDF